MHDQPMILLTGATGYVGGRLLRVLEERGERVRCMARRPGSLTQRTALATEVVKGDVFDTASLERALAGVDVAFYLIHSMGSTGGFEEMDRRAARNFVSVATKAGVKRIVYLGGLGQGPKLSAHLRSRQEVGRIFRASDVCTIELQASIVIGSGSLSFELVRALTERLPMMIMPRWVQVKAQPIGIEDLLGYLYESIRIPISESRMVEVGGQETLSYRDLMEAYARERGLPRLMIEVPFLSPWLSSLWLGLVTPGYARVGKKLIEGVRNQSVVENKGAIDLYSVSPMSAREAIKRALICEEKSFEEGGWSGAVSSAESRLPGPETAWMGVRYIDRQVRCVKASPVHVFRAISRIGGRNGWYAFNGLWRMRGAIDYWVGGVGSRRGRPYGRDLQSGDHLDFWRVERFEAGRLLRLVSEMKLPGKAWLEFEVKACGQDTEIHQTAIFYPSGLAGRFYWYAVLPFHALVFQTMIRNMGVWAEREALREEMEDSLREQTQATPEDHPSSE